MFKMTYPNSFLKLLLIGFALSMLPLLVAFVNANLYFGKLTKQSLNNLSQAVETTRNSRILLEELTVMERSARQYFVLHDRLLQTNYANSHDRFSVAANALLQLPISKAQHSELNAFIAQEKSLFSTISAADETMTLSQPIVESFKQLSNQSTKIINQNNVLIDKESATLKEKIGKTQRLLFWQSLTLIPLSIIIAGLITWMIARPIRRMDAAIKQLGGGDYEHAIAINGPGDLRQLGARLDWLRVALKDVHQQKQRFMQQASHELKTPLTAIREASELLNDGVAGELNAKQAEVLTILRDNSVRLQKMIENLLKYTEIQFNAENLTQASLQKTAPESLKNMVNEITQAYALTLSHKNISLQQSVSEQMMSIDCEKFRAILDNLVSNAVKFTPDFGEIMIRSEQTKNKLIIEVIDSGPGVSEANQAGLFDPFYRGEAPNNSLVNGSGLGLFIAKEAVIALKGEIQLLPTEQGAHFKVSVPV
jgi:two-component system, NtrC family, sensor histidine kinase GlrK